MKRREILAGLVGGTAAFSPYLTEPIWAREGANDRDPDDRPNILWVVIEDTSAYELGCYGNPAAKTPVIDALARTGVRYARAWSAAPQCSPSRSSIITGSFSTTYGMDWHRRPTIVPDDIFFPPLLRRAGYFCTNNAKTDYNARINPKTLWDESGRDASYNSPRRKPGQPFFAVFNCDATHMSRIRSFTLQGRPDFAADGLDPGALVLPPHVPDLPEVRSDYAFHLQGVQDIDRWVGYFMDDLKARGLDEDTIVFFYSDHGGCQPRGKGFLYDTGLRVPLIVRTPERFRYLSATAPGTSTDRLVQLMDLGPTVLSLAGVSPPPWMAGRAFMGRHDAEPRRYQYAFASNQSVHFVPARSISDGRFHLVRSYVPHKPYCLRNAFQWGMPANLAWDDYALRPDKANAVWLQSYRPRKGETLFDLHADPFETSDLSGDPKYQSVRERLATALDAHLSSTRDIGLLPPSMRHPDVGAYRSTRDTNYPVEHLLAAARLAACAEPDDAARLEAYLSHSDPAIRFWGASGFATLAVLHPGKAPVTPGLARAMYDDDPYVAMEAAHALCHLGQSKTAVRALMEAFGAMRTKDAAYSALETLAWTRVGRLALRSHEADLRRIGRVSDEQTSGMHPEPTAPAMDDGGEDGAHDWQARSILVSMGALPVSRLYTAEEQHVAWQAVNRTRKRLRPLPTGTTGSRLRG